MHTYIITTYLCLLCCKFYPINFMSPLFFLRSEEEGEDEVDSDFSIEENDEPISDHEEEKPKKARRLITKAYKVRKIIF